MPHLGREARNGEFDLLKRNKIISGIRVYGLNPPFNLELSSSEGTKREPLEE